MTQQFNVRIPESTEEQIDFLLKKTGMTQTQLVIQAIDRMYIQYKKEEKQMIYTFKVDYMDDEDMSHDAVPFSIEAANLEQAVAGMHNLFVEQYPDMSEILGYEVSN